MNNQVHIRGIDGPIQRTAVPGSRVGIPDGRGNYTVVDQTSHRVQERIKTRADGYQKQKPRSFVNGVEIFPNATGSFSEPDFINVVPPMTRLKPAPFSFRNANALEGRTLASREGSHHYNGAQQSDYETIPRTLHTRKFVTDRIRIVPSEKSNHEDFRFKAIGPGAADSARARAQKLQNADHHRAKVTSSMFDRYTAPQHEPVPRKNHLRENQQNDFTLNQSRQKEKDAIQARSSIKKYKAMRPAILQQLIDAQN